MSKMSSIIESMSGVSSEDPELEVTPGRLLPGAEQFYTSGLTKNISSLVPEDDITQKKDQYSVEVMGRYIIDRIYHAAKSLKVQQFIVPVTSADFRSIPVVRDVEVYRTAFCKYDEEEQQFKRDAIARVSKAVELSKATLTKLQKKLMKLSNSSEECVEASRLQQGIVKKAENTPEYEDARKLAAEKLAELKKAQRAMDKMESDVLSAQAQWDLEDENLRRLKMELKRLQKAADKAAYEQHKADTDAVSNITTHLAVLKKYVHSLVSKVKAIEEVARMVGPDGSDPMVVCDMRQVYANLTQRYRRNDSLGVTTTIMSLIRKDQQSSQTPKQFFAVIENAIADLETAGVKTVPLKDLGAMCAIMGFTKGVRDEFMKIETTLLLSNAAEDGSEFDVSDGVSVRSSVNKPMYIKVRDFVRTTDDMNFITASLEQSGKPTGSSKSTSGSTQSLAQSSNSSKSMEQKKSGQSRPPRREGDPLLYAIQSALKDDVCFNYWRNGVCNDSKCSKTHTQTVNTSPRKCDLWPNCGYGEKCFKQHGDVKIAAGMVKVAASGGAAKSSAAQAPQPSKPASSKGQSESLLVVREESPTDFVTYEEYETTNCVLVDQDKNTSESVFAAKVDAASGSVKLLIDSAASVNLASDLSLMEDVRKLKYPKPAHGLGGKAEITHAGTIPLFGGAHFVHSEGQTHMPNLLSVGRFTQPDEAGNKGVVMFGSKGGVRIRMDDEFDAELNGLLDKAMDRGLIVGRSYMRGYVYEENYAVQDAKQVPQMDEFYQANAVLSLAGGRIKMDAVESMLHLFMAAGLSKDALLNGLENHSLLGIPAAVTKESIEDFYKRIGKDVPRLEAEITRQNLNNLKGYEAPKEKPQPGSVLVVDAFDPSFSKTAEELESKELADRQSKDGQKVKAIGRKKTVPSEFGGNKDAVMGVDGASLFMKIVPRTDKANPEDELSAFIDYWKGQWPKDRLKVVRVDDEFSTIACIKLIEKSGAILVQAVPGDHRFATSTVEGCIRWIQDAAQGHMNRITPLVKEGVITDKEKRSFWFYAVRMAMHAWNLETSKFDKEKTRYEEGTGVVASLHNFIMLPFGMRIVAKKLKADGDGRGVEGLYLGPTANVKGGIITFSLVTRHTSLKFGFIPVIPVEKLSVSQYLNTAQNVYGKLATSAKIRAEEKAAKEASQSVAESSSSQEVAAEPASGGGVTGPAIVDSSAELEVSHPDETKEETQSIPQSMELSAGPPDMPVELELVQPTPKVKKKREEAPIVPHQYGTRRRPKEQAFPVIDRGPKPVAPRGGLKLDDPEWRDADLREATKLNEEDTFTPLPRGPDGKYILPPGAIVLRMLRVREYKWKKHPKTGEECWLPCARFVCDGSTDHRPDKFYAETPDRTLLLLMTSIGATTGERVSTSDVERAYLNAQSIDRNIVVKASSDMVGLPRMALLNKGLYGSRGGSLSWQIWIDERMKELGWTKLDVARGVYIKFNEKGEIVRAYRHSDDFRLSSHDLESRVAEEVAMRGKVRMAAFVACERFLGCTFEYRDDLKIVLVFQKDKILEMKEKFQSLHATYNKQNRVRAYPVPANAIQNDEDLLDGKEEFLDKEGQEQYMSLVGCIGWVAGSSRPDVKFGHYLLSSRMVSPRQWDMWLAVHVMDYLVGTVDTPLVLGGPVVQPEVHADASFANLDEGRSAVGHVLTTCPGSGAVYASVSKTKCAVTSVFEAELVSGCMGVDTALYATQACLDLMYPIGDEPPVVKVDNQAEVDWINGSVSNKRTRHLNVRWYRVRHLQESGEVKVEYVNTRENVADVLTKPIVGSAFKRAAGMILGHRLVQGVGIPGVFEISDE